MNSVRLNYAFYPAPGYTVTCTAVNPAAPSIIECINIQGLYYYYQYEIQLRVYLPNSGTPSTFPANFGELRAYAKLADGSYSTYEAMTPQTAAELTAFVASRCLRNSGTFVATVANLAIYDNLGIHSRPINSNQNVGTTAAEGYGIKVSADLTAGTMLVFYLALDSNDFNNAWTYGTFVRIYGNGNLFGPGSSYNCRKPPTCTLTPMSDHCSDSEQHQLLLVGSMQSVYHRRQYCTAHGVLGNRLVILHLRSRSLPLLRLQSHVQRLGHTESQRSRHQTTVLHPPNRSLQRRLLRRHVQRFQH